MDLKRVKVNYYLYLLALAILKLAMDPYDSNLPPYQAKFLFTQPEDPELVVAPDSVILDNLKPYDESKLAILKNQILEVSGKEGFIHLVDLARTWGPRSDSLNLIDPDKVDEYLTHSYYLIDAAQYFVSKGYHVLLIESTNNQNVRCFKDIDLVLRGETKEGYGYTFVDITVHEPQSDPIDGWWTYDIDSRPSKDSIITKKLNKLIHKSSVIHDSIVMGPISDFRIGYNLKFDLDKTSSYGNDFQKISNIINLCKQITVEEVNIVMEKVAPRLKTTKLESGLIRSYPRLRSVYDASLVVRSLSANDATSSNYHLRVTTHIDRLFKEGDTSSSRLYSTKIVDNLFNTLPKSTFFSPAISLKPTNTRGLSMVQRAKLLIQHLLRNKKKLPTMTLLVSLCVDDEYHPNEKEKRMFLGLVADPLWGRLKLRKIQQKDTDIPSPCHFFSAIVDDSFEDYHEYMYGGSSVGGVTAKLIRNASNPDIVYPDEYEHTLDKIADSLYRPMPSGTHMRTLRDLVEDSMPRTRQIGLLVKDVASKTLDSLDNTMLLNWLEGNNMISEALSNIKKASKHYVRDRQKSSRSFGLFVNEIGDRNGLVFATTSFSSDTACDCSICIEGDLTSPDPTGLLISKNDGIKTKWFNLSRSDHDWNIESFPDFLSYYSMLSDMTTSLEPHLDRTHDLKRDSAFGLGLMIMNNTRFCQVSNQVRHMFNNCAGISNGTMDLYNKIDWYKPSNFVECLYMLRMHKMTTMMQLLKANEDIELALKNYTSEMKDGRNVIGYKKSHWQVAMPSVTRAMPTDQRLYSSFYTSYAFANNRYNLILLQSQVFLKQVESREDFVLYRKSPRSTDVSNLPMYPDKYSLLKDMSDKIFTTLDGGQHKPCHLTVTLSSMASIIKIHSPKANKTIGEITDAYYGSTNIFSAPTASSVANNRSSVLSRGYGGNLPIKIIKKKIRTAKGLEKMVNVTENQTAKSYETLFLEMISFAKRKPLQSHKPLGVPVTNAEYDNVTRLTSEDIKFLTMHTCKIWPTLLHSIHNNHSVVARMIHKDDQKPREIAIMNMFLRLIAFNVEEMSRAVQKVEMAHGDYTNLIEQEDKDKRAASTYIKYKGYKKQGRKIIYDNEDKSGWGPSQDVRVFYITIGLRVPQNEICNLLGLLLQRFTSKHFKIPDKLYLKSLSPTNYDFNVNSSIGKSLSYLQQSHADVYDKNRGCLYANEGMFQGTLSVTSSCAAADCMRFSCQINTILYKSVNLTVEGHVTSDDSVRAMSFNETETLHTMVKFTLHVHNEISKNYSYKRNMSCSVHSTYVYELNSVFHTSDGKIIPSIKSRLSFVTYSHQTEMYSSALEIVSKTAEYLRIESSVMGSFWVNVLKTWCHLQQFQLTNLYRDIGRKIFTIPLEIGGLPTIDPLLSVCATPTSNFYLNYGEDFSYLLTFFNDISKYESLINEELTIEERQQYSIKQTTPRMTRSSVTSLLTRECKDKRIIRETIMSLSKDSFKNLSVSGGSVIKSLIQTFSREGVYFSESGLVNRFSIPQVPLSAKVFFLAPGIIREIFGDTKRVSRLDLMSAAKSYNFSNITGIAETNRGVSCLKKSYIDLAVVMQQDHDNYYDNMTRLRPIKAVPILSSSFISKVVDSYVEYETLSMEIERFENYYKPVELGGNTQIHPVLFYDMKSTFSQKIRKMAFRLQKMRFTSSSDDQSTSVAQRLLQTNFIEGSALVFSEIAPNRKPTVENLHAKLESYLSSTHTIIKQESPMTLERCIKSDLFSAKIDITGLISYGTNACPREWGNLSKSKNSFELLRSKINCGTLEVSDQKASIYTRQPGYPRKQQIYQENKIYLAQHPVEITHTGRYTRVVEKIENKYKHYISIWEGTVVEMSDKGNDKYSYMDYTDSEHIRIYLQVVGGILCVMDNGHILLCICRDRLGLGPYQLISSDSETLITENIVRNHLMEFNESIYDIYRDLSKFRANVDIAEFTTVVPRSANKLSAREQIEEIQLGLIEEGSESSEPFWDGTMNFERVSDSDSQGEQDYDDYDDDYNSDSTDEDGENFDLLVGEPLESRMSSSIEVTSGDRDDPTPDRFEIHGMISDYGINKLSTLAAMAMRRRNPNYMKNIWMIKVPMDLNVRVHSNNLIEDIFEILLKTMSSDSIDFLWCKYYILQSILVDPLELAVYENIRKSILDEKYTDDIMSDADLQRYLRELGIDVEGELGITEPGIEPFSPPGNLKEDELIPTNHDVEEHDYKYEYDSYMGSIHEGGNDDDLWESESSKSDRTFYEILPETNTVADLILDLSYSDPESEEKSESS